MPRVVLSHPPLSSTFDEEHAAIVRDCPVKNVAVVAAGATMIAAALPLECTLPQPREGPERREDHGVEDRGRG